VEKDLSLCFLLTAGLGTRLRPWTNTCPKPALPFLNLPLMNFGFQLAHEAGSSRFLFNLHHLQGKVRQTALRLKPHCEDLAFSDETDAIQGSGGALDRARVKLKKESYFLVANGDEILVDPSKPLARLQETFFKDRPLACLLTCDHPELLKKFNAVWVKNGLVKGFGKVAPEPECRPVHYTGYKIFDREIFSFLPSGPSNIFYEVLVQAIAQGEKVTHCHLGTTGWYETGDPESFLSACHTLALKQQVALQRVHHLFGSELSFVTGKTDADILVCHPEDLSHAKSLHWQGLLVLGQGARIHGEHQLQNCILDCEVHLQNPGLIRQQMILKA
jgi:NDP-sugar pyrophosphorylase family protein